MPLNVGDAVVWEEELQIWGWRVAGKLAAQPDPGTEEEPAGLSSSRPSTEITNSSSELAMVLNV